ncbi:hypothetical protein EGW08_017246 [Elysia chlorotica]|uniref:Uncharacterized protein n=1 Tax=Elysia chlorotica TaxID=188477 RepID=A0A433T0E0_ELYCH|nr:hypothetical protein EGW08_017246 [Elysia chlorotica]
MLPDPIRPLESREQRNRLLLLGYHCDSSHSSSSISITPGGGSDYSIIPRAVIVVPLCLSKMSESISNKRILQRLASKHIDTPGEGALLKCVELWSLNRKAPVRNPQSSILYFRLDRSRESLKNSDWSSRPEKASDCWSSRRKRQPAARQSGDPRFHEVFMAVSTELITVSGYGGTGSSSLPLLCGSRESPKALDWSSRRKRCPAARQSGDPRFHEVFMTVSTELITVSGDGGTGSSSLPLFHGGVEGISSLAH